LWIAGLRVVAKRPKPDLDERRLRLPGILVSENGRVASGVLARARETAMYLYANQVPITATPIAEGEHLRELEWVENTARRRFRREIEGSPGLLVAVLPVVEDRHARHAAKPRELALQKETPPILSDGGEK
jgi:hypothetical protein